MTKVIETEHLSRRPNAEILEQEREAYIRTLPRVRISSMLEAVELSKHAKKQELFFCNDMARLYGCGPLKADGDNLGNFLVTLFHYGKIQGIRQERARKRRKQQVGLEVAEIARILTENHLLYQVMEAAAEIQSEKARDKGIEKMVVEQEYRYMIIKAINQISGTRVLRRIWLFVLGQM